MGSDEANKVNFRVHTAKRLSGNNVLDGVLQQRNSARCFAELHMSSEQFSSVPRSSNHVATDFGPVNLAVNIFVDKATDSYILASNDVQAMAGF